MSQYKEILEALEERGLLEASRDIANSHHATMFEVCGRTRYSTIVRARHAIWLYLRTLGFSYPEIARIWDVDHTSVLSAVKREPPKAPREAISEPFPAVEPPKTPSKAKTVKETPTKPKQGRLQ